jgi:chromosome segregation ATPase
MQNLLRQLEEKDKTLRTENAKLGQAAQVARADAEMGRTAILRVRSAEQSAAQLKAALQDLQNQYTALQQREAQGAAEYRQLKIQAQSWSQVQHQWKSEVEKMRARMQSLSAENTQYKKDVEFVEHSKKQIEQEIQRIEESVRARADAQLAFEIEKAQKEFQQRIELARKDESDRVRKELSQLHEQWLREERTRWTQIVQDREREIQQLKAILRSGGSSAGPAGLSPQRYS